MPPLKPVTPRIAMPRPAGPVPAELPLGAPTKPLTVDELGTIVSALTCGDPRGIDVRAVKPALERLGVTGVQCGEAILGRVREAIAASTAPAATKQKLLAQTLAVTPRQLSGGTGGGGGGAGGGGGTTPGTWTYGSFHFTYEANCRDDWAAGPVKANTDEGGVIGQTDSGVVAPRYVQLLGFWLDWARARYVNDFGFRDPVPQGGQIEVVVYDPAVSLGGMPYAGHIEISNKLDDNGLAMMVCHLLFHLVEWNYISRARQIQLSGTDMPGTWFWTDGCADVAAHLLCPSAGVLRTYWDGTAPYLRPEVPVPTLWTWQGSITWKYFLERAVLPGPKTPGQTETTRQGRILADAWTYAGMCQTLGMPVFRGAWARVATPGTAFADFTVSQPNGSDTYDTETFYGDWIVALMLMNGTPDTRWTIDRPRPMTGILAWQRPGMPDPVAGTLTSAYSLKPWNFIYRYFSMDAPEFQSQAKAFRLQFAWQGKVLIQIALLNSEGKLVDLIRSTRSSLDRTISARQGWVQKIVVCVAALDNSGEILGDITTSFVDPVPDLMIQSWNCVDESERNRDPLAKPWDWRTYQLTWTDTYRKDAAGKTVYGGSYVMGVVVNWGSAAAQNVRVRVQCQAFSESPADTGWQPLLTPAGNPVVVSIGDIPFSTICGGMQYCRRPAAMSKAALALRGVIETATPDSSLDNNVALSSCDELKTVTRDGGLSLGKSPLVAEWPLYGLDFPRPTGPTGPTTTTVSWGEMSAGTAAKASVKGGNLVLELDSAALAKQVRANPSAVLRRPPAKPLATDEEALAFVESQPVTVTVSRAGRMVGRFTVDLRGR